MTWFGSFIKAADLAVLVSVLAMLWLYVRALVALRREVAHGFARNLCLGIVVGWTGNAVLFGNLVLVYWTGELPPSSSPAIPVVRVVYTILTLLGCAMHITTSLATGRRWWTTLFLMVLTEAALILAVASIDMRGIV